jgi:murein DD-endopeptidase MepM/ murein hydrolase activator NlpD
MKIFPQLNGAKWKEINLNEEAKRADIDFINPSVCGEWIRSLHTKLGVDFTFGGFKEDRSHILANHYNKDEGKFIHLGVDYNVPSGTNVHAFANGRVYDLFNDKDQNGGWGGRVITRLDNGLYAIFGHLSQNTNLRLDQRLRKGDLIGLVGEPSENGGWFEHLHVQIVDQILMGKYFNKLNMIDGYAARDSDELKHVYDPKNFIC